MSALLAFLGRVMLCVIFVMSAVGNKIPNFEKVVGFMEQAGVPNARNALMGAIGCLIVGSLSVAFGIFARFGALLLLAFLVAATYYFHPFWKFPQDDPKFEAEMINAMKNLALMGAMVFIMGNGAGPGSFDNRSRTPTF